MLYKGLKFGMILQLAIGPICLLVFNTSSTNNFSGTLLVVLAVTLVDMVFIALASMGMAVFINKPKMKKIIQTVGCFILVLFGLNILLGAFASSPIPDIALFSNTSGKNLFIQGLVLTASNPLTIIFWGGVFSTQIAENNFNKKQLILFGAGCALSTLIFLSIVAVIGSFMGSFLPQSIIQILNGIVGVLLIFFGFRLLFKKEKSGQTNVQ